MVVSLVTDVSMVTFIQIVGLVNNTMHKEIAQLININNSAHLMMLLNGKELFF